MTPGYFALFTCAHGLGLGVRLGLVLWLWMARGGCEVACINVVMLTNILKNSVCEYFIHLNGWNSI